MMPLVNHNKSSDKHGISDIFQDMNIMYYMQIATNLQVTARGVAAVEFCSGLVVVSGYWIVTSQFPSQQFHLQYNFLTC